MGVRNVVCLICLTILAAASAQETVHVMKKGETLYGLARTYGVPYSAIVSANGIVDANNIRVGQKIRIPAETPLRHTVAKGETLFGIARKYDLTVSELRELNGFSASSVLKAGDVLTVGKRSEPKAPAPVEALPAARQEPKKEPVPPKPEEVRPVTPKRNDPTLRWPVRAKEVAYMEGKLYGVLLTGERAERVESLTAGTVVSAEPYRGFGKVAIVQAADGHVYVYGGNETLSVKPGDRIASGTEVGRLGIDSLTGKPALFFFVYKDNIAVDPAKAPRS
jgi:lipoprotein NlpD